MCACNQRKLRRISDHQTEVLEYVKQHLREHGFPPTLREIASWFGWASTGAASKALAQLEAKGFLRLHVGRARGITVLP